MIRSATDGIRSLAGTLAVSLALSSCAHVGEGQDPVALTGRVIREACIPFVVDGVDDDQVGRALGGWWTRNLPDPFTPPIGPIFRRGSATVQIVDGRRARTYDGALTSRPMRSCVVWLGKRINEAELIATVRAATESRPDAAMADPVRIDGTRRIVACIPSGHGRIAVVSVLGHPNGQSGANVYETSAGPRNCVG